MTSPNIILVNCDDLGYGDLGCYGSKVNKTPLLDKLAREGLLLTDFYMAAPVCSPSRGAMLTGCYPARIGFADFDGASVLFPGDALGLSQNETTIATLLQEQGYETMLIGKWHCGDQPEFMPTRHGFAGYYGLPYSNDMGRQAGPGHEWPPLPLLAGEEVIQQQPDQRSLTERYVEKATGFIHHNRTRPFFLYLAHMHVHLPLYAAERFVQQSANGDYGACVEAIDWAMACLLQQLQADQLLEKTLIIFTSDNGSRGDNGGSNSPLRGNKASTWEGGQRVPCIFYWPGQIPPGASCSQLVSSLDFLPTICRLTGARPRSSVQIDGLDISSLLQNPLGPPVRQTFFYYFKHQLEAVRHKNWKLHVHKGKQKMLALYDLATDPGEQNDLSQVRSDLVKQLQGLLDTCRQELGDSLTGQKGRAVRPVGRVAKPQPLTSYNPDHPYIVAMYDKAEKG